MPHKSLRHRSVLFFFFLAWIQSFFILLLFCGCIVATKTAKIYDVKFEFKRNEKTGQESFKIKVNGVTPATAIKNDPQALEVLKNHPDLKGISDTQIKKGFINDNGGLRPMDMKLDATGKEIQAEKAKEQGFER